VASSWFLFFSIFVLSSRTALNSYTEIFRLHFGHSASPDLQQLTN